MNRPTLEPGPPRSPAVALLVGLLAFAITVVWLDAGQGTVREDRRAELVSIVAARQKRALSYERRLERLRRRADAMAAASGTVALQRLRALGDAAAALSGATAVTGPGLVVEVADAPGADRATLDTNSRILDVDLQAIANELWAAGAEAIAINGQRLVATTAIRNAGAAVLVNYRVLSSPYRVQAVGDPGSMRTAFDGSEIAGHFHDWKAIYGLGFSVAASDEVALPAFNGSLRFRHAHVIKEG